jgi:hypothetical protein
MLLCKLLYYNLYDQAEYLRSKAPRFEAHSNQQVIKVVHEPSCRMSSVLILIIEI